MIDEMPESFFVLDLGYTDRLSTGHRSHRSFGLFVRNLDL